LHRREYGSVAKKLSEKEKEKGRTDQSNQAGGNASGTRGNSNDEVIVIAGAIALSHSTPFTSPIDPVGRKGLVVLLFVVVGLGKVGTRSERGSTVDELRYRTLL
jgi:hypothetical protein